MSDEPSTRMICHYDVMELDFSCKLEDIKKQYKILALKYHPDRNHGDEENATHRFKLLAAAFAVLSDPHERTWYDDHREAILRGGNGVAGDDSDDDDEPPTVSVWRYFNSNCYSGTSDDSPTGFYTVYGECFDEIIESENDVTQREPTTGSSKGFTSNLTQFGNSTTPIADVLFFYSEWENFTSKLNFSWADVYRSVDAPNRATRRVMEKDNLKARDEAKKDFINEIRSLARFVKKRDPRILAYESGIRTRRIEEEERRRVQKAEELKAKKERREQLLQEHEKDTEWVEVRDNERKAAFLLADNEDETEETIKMSGGLGGDGYESDEEIRLQNKLRKAKLAERRAQAEADGVEFVEEELVPEPVEEDGKVYTCTLCEKDFASEAKLAHHCTSKPHRKKASDALKKLPKVRKKTGSVASSDAPTEMTAEDVAEAIKAARL